jgi:Catalase
MTPSTDWKERVANDETARFDKLAAILSGIQRERSERHPMGRALHYKPHAGVLATFTVLPDLPEWCRVGIFAEPRTYPAYARFSNGSGSHQPDTEPDVRGLAVKVVGVPGAKFFNPDALTQDFLAILTASVPFATPEEFVGLVRAFSGNKLLALLRLIGLFGARTLKVLGALKAGLAQKHDSLAVPTFYSALPIMWGPHAVKYSFAAIDPPAPTPLSGKDGYRQDLQGHLATRGLRFAFRIQGFRDEATTPIEDNTVEWLPEQAPWVTVAELVMQPQPPTHDDPDGLAAFIEALSFDPWHAPLEFRPLGAMQRARSAAYRDSTITRSAAPEPDGSETWHRTVNAN